MDIFHTYRWSPYGNGLPFGVTATDIDVNSNGNFLRATFGRGAFVLSSRQAPADTNGSVTGHVVTFEQERLHDGPAGSTNPLITTVEIDARPGWVFSGTNVGAAAYVLKAAYTGHRLVTLAFKITGTNHGTIISAH